MTKPAHSNLKIANVQGVTISAPGLERDIGLPLTRNDQISIERIMSIIEKILQSNHTFLLEKGIVIRILRVELPHGGVRSETHLPFDKSLLKKA